VKTFVSQWKEIYQIQIFGGAQLIVGVLGANL
jgi:hypothetical protein